MDNNNNSQKPNETYLGFIQSTITRMGQNSFQAKAWGITIVTALQAFMLEKLDDDLKLICYIMSIFVTVLFGHLDIYYLYLERGYRVLYNIAAKINTNSTVVDFDMKIPNSERGVNKFFKAFFSLTTGGFYTAVIVCLILIYVLVK